jgi:hypothetical protein
MLHGNTCGVSTAAHIHVLKCIVHYAYYVPPEYLNISCNANDLRSGRLFSCCRLDCVFAALLVDKRFISMLQKQTYL